MPLFPSAQARDSREQLRQRLINQRGNSRSGSRPSSETSGPSSSSLSPQIFGLLTQQQDAADRNQRDTLADRDAALGLLSDRLNSGRSEEFQSTFESLSQDPGDTPFAQILRNSIQDTLENPEVFTEQDIQGFVSRANESSARSVQDAILSTSVDNAQRGVQGGIPQGLEQQLRLQGSADAIAAEGDIRFQASEAESNNRAFAQQLGVNFETATQQARNSRLQTLSQFVSETEVRDLELVTGMAEILANTARENPDFSGYASLLLDAERQANDVLIQRENLELLRQQIAVQERLGVADASARNGLAQAQLQFNQTLSTLQNQISDFERQVAEQESA